MNRNKGNKSMKKRTMLLLLVGLVSMGIEAKGKKNKARGEGRGGGGQMQMMPAQSGLQTMPGTITPMVSGQPMTDQQYLQEQLLGMQKTETAELKSKIMAIKAKNAANKRVIDQGLSELVSGSVILYKK
jgi:hypothetical protein